MTTMHIRQQDNYGTPTNYPACDVSKLFCQVAGTKTLPNWMVRTIEDSGLYKIEVVASPTTSWR